MVEFFLDQNIRVVTRIPFNTLVVFVILGVETSTPG